MTTPAPSRSASPTPQQARMVALLKEIAVGEGIRPSKLESVKLMRADRCYPRSPVLYDPSIVIIAQGRKHGYLGGHVFTYDPQHYLVLSVPLPFECETIAPGEREPMLGVSVSVDVGTVSELLMKVGHKAVTHSSDDLTGVRATPLDAKLADATVRLLECLADDVDRPVLGPQIVREIIYRVLCGPQGDALRALVALNGKLGQIHRALQRMHTHFADPLDIESLADELAMSPSTFHHHFKAVTATSPLQYLKSIRLHKARMLMVQEGLNAGIAAQRVGYESPSQFSREFKRFFGNPPTEEVEKVRHILGLDGAAIPAPALLAGAMQ